MAETYTLHVAGLTRELTICKVNDHMDIAAFIMLGDAELTVAAAAELLKKCPDFDILLTAEAKGIPLAHEMSRQSGKPYVCARKGEKLYMTDPAVPSRLWTRWLNRPSAPLWARPLFWPRAMQLSARISSSWSRCLCSSTKLQCDARSAFSALECWVWS